MSNQSNAVKLNSLYILGNILADENEELSYSAIKRTQILTILKEAIKNPE